VFFLKSSGENPQEEPADLSGCLHYRLLLAKKEPADLSRQFLNSVTGLRKSAGSFPKRHNQKARNIPGFLLRICLVIYSACNSFFCFSTVNTGICEA